MTAGAERWLAFAREDLQMAELAMASGIYNQVGFHAQQCVEKVLKALLAAQGLAVPRTHAITDLLERLSEEYLPDTRSELHYLDDFYIPARYPDALPGTLPEGLPGNTEAGRALELARQVMQEAASMLAR
jgi:HEPN domain-containing protein